MIRTLSITLDDEARTIRIDNWCLFSLVELMGIGEHVRVRARLSTIRNIHKADEEAEDEDGTAEKRADE